MLSEEEESMEEYESDFSDCSSTEAQVGSSSSTSVNSSKPKVKKSAKVYKQKYRVAWEKVDDFKNWLKPVPSKPEMAKCTLCSRELRAVITALRKHKNTVTHKEKEEAMYGPTSRTIDTMFVNKRKQNLVQNAEIKIAAFVSEHNLSFNVMDHFTELVPQLFPDSEVASRFKSKRTKTKCIVTNVCAPFFHDVLIEKLQTTFFSLIIDETTDVSAIKELAMVCRFYDREKEKVVSHFYDMVPVTSATAESLYQAVISLFEKDKVPLANLIGFAADTTNTMYGEHNSVASKLKEANPTIYFMKCICHTAHLCASYACEKLPRTAEELLRDIYNYFAHSSKRQAEYSVVQQFVGVEPHKILRPCQTRWLSLHSCISRVLEQWNALIVYFEDVSQADNLLVSGKIHSLMTNPIWKLYFLFLNFVLAKFTDLNVMFQSASSSIHCLYAKVESVYKELLSCYMVKASWRYHPNICELDPSSQTHLLPLNKMYMGAQVALSLAQDVFKERSRSPDVHHFLKCVQDFFIEAATQIRKRFPLGDNTMRMLQVLDPNVSISCFPSLAPLVLRFTSILPETDIEKLDAEWRRLSLVELPFDKRDMTPDFFWTELDKITDGLGNPQFSTLCRFMQVLLCLPCSNVDVERIFSAVNDIKTKRRNKLLPSTVSALIKVKQGVIHSSNGCSNYKPPKGMLERMQSSILYSTHDETDSDDSD